MIGLLLLACFTPVGVVSETLETQNVIHDYEWFYDSYNNIEAKQLQIISSQETLRDFTISSESEEVNKFNMEEAQRVRIELAGQQASCRELVAKYNAESQKANVGIFRSGTLPTSISLSVCQ